jgi:hypothetical protein
MSNEHILHFIFFHPVGKVRDKIIADKSTKYLGIT